MVTVLLGDNSYCHRDLEIVSDKVFKSVYLRVQGHVKPKTFFYSQ